MRCLALEDAFQSNGIVFNYSEEYQWYSFGLPFLPPQEAGKYDYFIAQYFELPYMAEIKFSYDFLVVANEENIPWEIYKTLLNDVDAKLWKVHFHEYDNNIVFSSSFFFSKDDQAFPDICRQLMMEFVIKCLIKSDYIYRTFSPGFKLVYGQEIAKHIQCRDEKSINEV